MAGIPGAALTQLVPVSELAQGQAAGIRNELIKFLLDTASFALKLARERLVVRDILCDTDLDYSAEDWGEVTGTTANAYETMSTGTMGDNRWIGIFGVKTSELCAVTALRFNIGGGDRTYWQLQALSSQDDYVGISPSPLIIPQNAPYTISRYVAVASSSAFVLLKGIVVEPRGKTVSP